MSCFIGILIGFTVAFPLAIILLSQQDIPTPRGVDDDNRTE
jgi:hypothetical protein